MADPYWERFCTPLARRIIDLIGATATGGPAARPFILEENIEAVLGNGRYRIGGIALAAKGKAMLTVGQRVHVLWKNDRRHLILTHKWKRGQGGGGVLQVGYVVEELWLARPSVASTEVWYRNAVAAVPLGIAAHLPPEDIGNMTAIVWGPPGGDHRFLVTVTTATITGSPPVLTFHRKYYVFQFDREPGEGLADTADPATSYSLLRVETVTGKTAVLYVFTPVVSLDPGGDHGGFETYPYPNCPITLTLADMETGQRQFGDGGWSSCNASSQEAYLDADGNVCVRGTVGATIRGRTQNPTATTVLFFHTFSYDFVADLTHDTILLHAETAELGAAGPAVSANVLDFGALPSTITLETEGTAETLDLWFIYYYEETIAREHRYTLGPMAVTPEAEVTHYLAGRRLGPHNYQTVQSVNSIPLGTIPPPPGALNPPPASTEDYAVIVTAQGPAGAVTLHEVAYQPPQQGVYEIRTARHVVFYAAFNESIFSTGQEFYEHGADALGPLTVADVETGELLVVDTTADVPTFTDRNIRAIPGDFLYQADQPYVALPTEAATRFFVLGWSEDGTPVLAIDVPGFPVEDAALAPFKALADVPDEAIAGHRRDPGTSAYHAVNGALLESVGRAVSL